jgi:hypothetical protein
MTTLSIERTRPVDVLYLPTPGIIGFSSGEVLATAWSENVRVVAAAGKRRINNRQRELVKAMLRANMVLLLLWQCVINMIPGIYNGKIRSMAATSFYHLKSISTGTLP